MVYLGAKVKPRNSCKNNILQLDGREDGNSLPFEDRHTHNTVLDLLGLCLMHCYLHCLLEIRAACGGLVFSIDQFPLNLVIVSEITHSMRWSVKTSSPKCHQESTETNRCKFLVG